MKIKRKLSLGLVFLFSVITLLIGLGSIYILKLSNESEEILKDNSRSLEYAEEMLKALDTVDVQSFEKSLIAQETNITENGEEELTQNVRTQFERWRNDPGDLTSMLQLRSNL